MTINERVAASIRRHPGHSNCEIARNFKGLRSADVQAIRETMSNADPTQAVEDPAPFKVAGISLANRSVLSRRPAESAAKYIRKLPNGKAYAPSDLSKAWGMSEETIRKHARDLGCLKFVEVEPDEWKPMIMNPDTAKNYHL